MVDLTGLLDAPHKYESKDWYEYVTWVLALVFLLGAVAWATSAVYCRSCHTKDWLVCDVDRDCWNKDNTCSDAGKYVNEQCAGFEWEGMAFGLSLALIWLADILWLFKGRYDGTGQRTSRGELCAQLSRGEAVSPDAATIELWIATTLKYRQIRLLLDTFLFLAWTGVSLGYFFSDFCEGLSCGPKFDCGNYSCILRGFMKISAALFTVLFLFLLKFLLSLSRFVSIRRIAKLNVSVCRQLEYFNLYVPIEPRYRLASARLNGPAADVNGEDERGPLLDGQGNTVQDDTIYALQWRSGSWEYVSIDDNNVRPLRLQQDVFAFVGHNVPYPTPLENES